nr:neurotoxin 1-15 precursor [Nematostella vectensis]
MALFKIVIACLAVLVAVACARRRDMMSDDELDFHLSKRGIPCACDSDGPDIRSASLSGIVWMGSCPSGWKKCKSYYSIVADCCNQ